MTNDDINEIDSDSECLYALKHGESSINTFHYKMDNYEMFFAQIAKSTTLTSLDVNNRKIEPSEWITLAKSLANNHSLTSLRMRDQDSINSLAIQKLSDSLRINDTLTQLNLSWNNICSKGATALAQALMKNKTLKHLDLSYNGVIGSDGAVSIAQALQQNNTLEYLSLQCNEISNPGAQALGNAMKFNTTLHALDISANKIEFDSLAHLCHCLESNTTLTDLRFGYNEVTQEEYHQLFQILFKNISITKGLDFGIGCIDKVTAVTADTLVKRNLNIQNNIYKRNKTFWICAGVRSSAYFFNEMQAIKTKLEIIQNQQAIHKINKSF